MVQIFLREADNIRIRFEADCNRVGEGLARKVFSRVLNTEGRKTNTAVKAALATQTSIPKAMVNAAVKFRPAGPRRLVTKIEGSGAGIPLSRFKAKQTPAGVSAFVWGRQQIYPHTFMVNTFGNAYKRTTAARGPIEGLYGPYIPTELIKDASLAAFEQCPPKIIREVDRLLPLMLSGAVR